MTVEVRVGGRFRGVKVGEDGCHCGGGSDVRKKDLYVRGESKTDVTLLLWVVRIYCEAGGERNVKLKSLEATKCWGQLRRKSEKVNPLISPSEKSPTDS